MVENPAIASDEPEEPAKKSESWGGFAKFLIKLVAAVLVFRIFLFSPFTIPSESMLPRLMNGDYLVAAKWPYGYSRLSLPFDLPLGDGRIFADLPERGDIAIFKHPVDGSDYIKRVIGLPGDTLELRAGRVFLNGEPLQRVEEDDIRIATSPNTTCAWAAVEEMQGTRTICRYARFRETLPSGKSYDTLEFGRLPQDNFGPLVVPQGRLFVMGDNRDNSQDSRFPARAEGGVGLVPADLLVAKASMILWSSDGGAEWLKPWTWFTAARWERIGTSL